ncbi:MAG: hypothetical protein IT315_05255, partial [Anaerolineales bacterium]|nr:hypothetical protein [Anaerolineales bacterium]
MDPTLASLTCVMAALALGAFFIVAWLNKQTLYLPAQPEGSAPVNQEEERKRGQKIKSRRAMMVWSVFLGICILSYTVALAAPSAKKVKAVLFPSATPTV